MVLWSSLKIRSVNEAHDLRFAGKACLHEAFACTSSIDTIEFYRKTQMLGVNGLLGPV